MKPILLALFCLLLTISTPAQEETPAEHPDQPQDVYIFDQYNPNEIRGEAERQKIELFIFQVKNAAPSAYGRIYVYRGVADYKFDAEERRNTIEKISTSIKEKNSIESNRVSSIFGGFREESTVEMIVEPPQAGLVTATPTGSLLDLKFYNDADLPKGTIQKTGRELLNDITKKVDPLYPPAARAIRAGGEVGVLIKIDEKGYVIESKALTGHPLLRTACIQAAKQLQFNPQKVNGAAVKVVGLMVFELSPD